MSSESCWFHIIVTTYGAWLPGDERGFRTRHRREHIEGDYKNPPPPGKYVRYLERSRQALKQGVVTIPEALREKVGLAFKERLEQLGSLVVAIAVAGRHVHVLAKMPADEPRRWAGLAKKHVWFELRNAGWKGKLWGKRGKEIPVKDRPHQLNVFRYIKAHKDQGAWVWTWC